MEHFPLEYFRREMGFHPFFFWQLAGDALQPSASCDDLIFQYAWQDSDKLGRADIQRALDQSVVLLAERLGFSPLRQWSSVQIPWPTYATVPVRRYPFIDPRGEWIGVRLPNTGYVEAMGIKAQTVINNAAAVVYTDEDGDGYDDTFTLTQGTSVTDPSEIAVYFSPADRLGNEPDLESYRIQPIRVSFAGGNATISGPIWLAVLPAKYRGVAVTAVDPTDAANFPLTLSIQRITTYTAGQTFNDAQALFQYESRPVPWWGVCTPPTNGSSDPATVGYAVGRSGIRDARAGEVIPAKEVYDATSQTWSVAPLWEAPWEPDQVTLRYLAGYPLTSDAQIDPFMVQLVTRFAAAEMGRTICACTSANRELYRWQFDLARTGGSDDESYAYSPTDLDCPWSTRRGHLWAWRQVKRLALLGAAIP